jgi:hypothetical protein
VITAGMKLRDSVSVRAVSKNVSDLIIGRMKPSNLQWQLERLDNPLSSSRWLVRIAPRTAQQRESLTDRVRTIECREAQRIEHEIGSVRPQKQRQRRPIDRRVTQVQREDPTAEPTRQPGINIP